MLVRWRRFRRNDQVVLLVMAVVLGVASAYGAIGFRYLIGFVQWGAFGTQSEALLDYLVGLPEWRIVLAPAAGGLLVGLFIRYATHDKRPLGVADVIEGAALKGGRMSLRAGLGAAAISAVSLGAGASTGREGPVVHLGASLSAFVAERLRLGRSLSQTVLGCGVAAAVASP